MALLIRSNGEQVEVNPRGGLTTHGIRRLLGGYFDLISLPGNQVIAVTQEGLCCICTLGPNVLATQILRGIYSFDRCIHCGNKGCRSRAVHGDVLMGVRGEFP